MTSNESTGAPPGSPSDAPEPPTKTGATEATEAPSTASESDARSTEQTSDRPLSGGPLIFASDASAEGAGLTGALRGRGYTVVDVPLGLLVRRVAVQRPALILCDVDAAGALEATSQLRELPDGNRVDVLFIGGAGRTLKQMADRIAHEASAVFVRPVELYSLLRKVEALIGPPPSGTKPSAPPGVHRSQVLVAATRAPYRYEGRLAHPETPPLRSEGPDRATTRASPSSPASPRLGTSYPPSAPSSAPPAGPARLASWDERAGAARRIGELKLSSKVTNLLMDAEQRVSDSTLSASPMSRRLSPQEEVDAVVPPHVLEALDESLDYDDEEFTPVGAHTRGGSDPGRGDSEVRAQTGAGTPGAITAPPPTGATVSQPAPESLVDAAGEPQPPTPPQPRSQTAPQPSLAVTTPPRRRSDSPSADPQPPTSLPYDSRSVPHPEAPEPAVDRASDFQASAEPRAPEPVSTTPPRAVSGMPPADTSPQDSAALRTKAPELDIPTVLTRWQTVSVLARVVRSRFSGALTFEEAAGIRRVVVHDGDFVTVASGVEGESLISFLAERGDIAAETASHLGPRLPHFGRHAGAALIAHGHLRQDELWVVLRAHAEWLLGHIVLMSQGTASVDQEVPSRLQAEPAVFGGAPGAEVLVEIVRRVLPTQEALRALGGPRAQLLSGAYHHLLRECGLDDAANLLLEEIDGFSVGEAIARSGSPSFATVLYAIRELGIEEVRTDREGQAFSRGEDSSALDDEAVRRRVQARLALVEEADYFALLGVGRNATLHDVQRAYLALRTQFDPARVLSARTADLAGDVETILMVVEEAYEVLGDDSRRDRYRRALEASLH